MPENLSHDDRTRARRSGLALIASAPTAGPLASFGCRSFEAIAKPRRARARNGRDAPLLKGPLAWSRYNAPVSLVSYMQQVGQQGRIGRKFPLATTCARLSGKRQNLPCPALLPYILRHRNDRRKARNIGAFRAVSKLETASRLHTMEQRAILWDGGGRLFSSSRWRPTTKPAAPITATWVRLPLEDSVTARLQSRLW
jgi:hypothetical protein